MKLRRLSALGSALLLSVSALISFGFPGIANASAPYTCTWTGASNNNFNTAGNWTGCNSAAPQPADNDNLIFNTANLSAAASLTNDITGLNVGSMTFSGTSSFGFTLSGNALTLSGGITQSSTAFNELNLNITLSAPQTFTVSNGSALYIGDQTLQASHTFALGSNQLTINDSSNCSGVSFLSSLTGSGTINDSSTRLVLNAASPSYTGAVSANTGVLEVNDPQALGTGGTGVTVVSGAALVYGISANATFAQPITVSGTGVNGAGAIQVGGPSTNAAGCSGGGASTTTSTANLTGNITLQGNTTVGVSTYFNATVSGGLSGNFTLTVVPGDGGTLTVNASSNTSLTANGVQTAPQQTITVASGDNQPSQTVLVGTNQTYVIDGIRGDTNVESGGTLKGDGTVGNLFVSPGGIVAPGHSPGCLTVSGNLNEAGTYQAELGGTTACSGYDQIDVTGVVELDDANTPPTLGSLQVTLVNGFKPTAGQTFEIINNQGGKAIDDTFSGLPEGSEITVSGYVFKISYVGGTTGNSVVLTVVSVPTAPNTGFGLTSYHVGLPLIGGVMMAGGLYLISRRFKQPITSKRR